MINFFKKHTFHYFLFLSILLFQSCITDEFKFSELKFKEDYGVKIISPVFSGSDKDRNHLEFRDFIHDWKKPIGDLFGLYTVLQYSDSTYQPIPIRLIFDPSLVIDSLQFLI